LNVVLIAVSTYNQAEFFLPTCLKAIQEQTYEDFLCIVGDDQSTDNTKEVVESLNDDRFVYHLTPKKYVLNSYFYNWVAENYDNQYLITCDGDNFLLPTHVEKLVENIGNNVAVYGYANNLVFADDKRTVTSQYFRGEPWELNRYIYYTSYYNFIDMSDILFDRKAFIECGGYIPGLKYQDYSIMVRLAIMFKNRIGFVPEVLTYYSVLPDSQCRTTDADEESHKNIYV
jgi:glycosyltransferase involved in cell wall biosynthesis